MVYLYMGIYMLMQEKEGKIIHQSEEILTGNFLYTERDRGVLIAIHAGAKDGLEFQIFFLHNVNAAAIRPENVQAELWLCDTAAVEMIDGVAGASFFTDNFKAFIGWNSADEITYDLEFLDGTDLRGTAERCGSIYVMQMVNVLRSKHIKREFSR